MEKHGSPPAYPGASGKAAAFPPQEAFRTRFASVSMHDGDKLRFLNFPTEIITLAVDLVNRFWPKGLQRQAPSYGSVELKLCGYPWRGSSSDAVHARRFLNRVLQHLFDAGWVLTCRTDISKVVYDLDTMLFRQQVPPPAQCEWMCISFSNGDEVRFIDAPEELVTQMVQSLGSMVQRREPHRGGLAGVHQIKLNAYPFHSSSGSNSMQARILLLKLLECMEEHGWTVYGSIDQKATTNEHRGETDTWHCCKMVGWQPGMPVYHN